MFDVIKKIIAFAAMLIFLFFAGRKTLYWFGVWHMPVKPVAESAQALPFPSTGSYNFKRMLELVEASRDVRAAFYAHFTTVHAKKKHIDVQALKDLLAELYRERVRLRSHIQDLRGESKESISIKKRRTLLYYLKVLNQCIHDMENVLRKI